MTNWAKVIGLISTLIGLGVVAFPMPDIYKVYILGLETMLNGILQYWYGVTPNGPAATKESSTSAIKPQ